MYQIIKRDRKTLQNRVMIDQSNETVEFENFEEAESLCNILNYNSSGKHVYLVKHIHESLTNLASTEDIKFVSKSLSEAAEYGLQAECVVYALEYMKTCPDSPITEAMYHGLKEWVK
jgi:hypothetical protein